MIGETLVDAVMTVVVLFLAYGGLYWVSQWDMNPKAGRE